MITLKKDRERKRAKRELLKKSPSQHQEYKRKDHERKAAKKAAEQSFNSSTNSAPKKFSKQALGKAKHRAGFRQTWKNLEKYTFLKNLRKIQGNSGKI